MSVLQLERAPLQSSNRGARAITWSTSVKLLPVNGGGKKPFDRSKPTLLISFIYKQ